MSEVNKLISKNRKHLKLLSNNYPTIQSVCTEIINLRAILNLPKGTEYFMSDIHGENEAFAHILNNCSGVIRTRIEEIFSTTLTENECSELCTLIYYPEKKLPIIKDTVEKLDDWYESTLLQLIEVCKSLATKYTRSKVRKAMPREFSYILDELLHASHESDDQQEYYSKILESILALDNADDFIVTLTKVIKRLAVDRLHIVGDIFDRGPRPDLIMDMLINHHSVDIQWGNHDILWMGAAAGNTTCMAAVVCNCAAFANLRVLEEGYGINLRPLAHFAEKTYGYSEAFKLKMVEDSIDPRDAALSCRIYKAISIILFKLEGQLWRNHPEFDMQDRMLLHQIDFDRGEITIDNIKYKLKDLDFPTISTVDPYALTLDESRVVQRLIASFQNSERLEKHVDFLYKNGGMYKSFNQNLMFHGCIPIDDNGEFLVTNVNGEKVSGKALLDAWEKVARTAFYGIGKAKNNASDGMWYLWCGKSSPLFGRNRMTTFERLFINDKSTWHEGKNPYYNYIQEKDFCVKILEEFALYSECSHIINGHIPVRVGDGESPIKAGGRLIVIDGGFCKAYHPQTGIAGYTLIYNSYGLRLAAHKPFESVQEALEQNLDIHSTTEVFETMSTRMQVMDTDIGQEISEQIYDLSLLLAAYRSGPI